MGKTRLAGSIEDVSTVNEASKILLQASMSAIRSVAMVKRMFTMVRVKNIVPHLVMRVLISVVKAHAIVKTIIILKIAITATMKKVIVMK